MRLENRLLRERLATLLAIKGALTKVDRPDVFIQIAFDREHATAGGACELHTVAAGTGVIE